MKIQESESHCWKLNPTNMGAILWNHACEDCFRPYSALFSNNTQSSWPGIAKPSGCSTYMTSSRSLYRNAVLTSIWCTLTLRRPERSVNNVRMDVYLATGAKV